MLIIFLEIDVGEFEFIIKSLCLQRDSNPQRLSSNCHHQIICGKFHLKMFYTPPYERNIWHYKYEHTDIISKAIEGFDWDKAF